MTKRVLFFDDGGVLNENKVRGEQWNKLIADYFAPRYGGEREEWMKANVYAMVFVIEYLKEIQEKGLEITYRHYKERENIVWTEKMFEFMGIRPPQRNLYPRLVEEVNTIIVPQIRSGYPGMVDTIKELSLDYLLQTASNENSKTLDIYLQGMGVRSYFNYLFGPDLINVMKSNENYYSKILQYSKTQVQEAVIIDDSLTALQYAKSLGLEVVQSCLDGQKPELENYFTKPKELINILNQNKKQL